MSDDLESKILQELQALTEKKAALDWRRPQFWVSIVALGTIVIAVITWFNTIFIDKRVHSYIEEHKAETLYALEKKFNGNRGVIENSRDVVTIKRDISDNTDMLQQILKLVK